MICQEYLEAQGSTKDPPLNAQRKLEEPRPADLLTTAAPTPPLIRLPIRQPHGPLS